MNYIKLAKQTDGAWAGGVDWTWEELEAFAKLVAAHEREECAKLCHDEADDGTEGLWDVCCFSLAKKIMARGEA